MFSDKRWRICQCRDVIHHAPKGIPNASKGIFHVSKGISDVSKGISNASTKIYRRYSET